MKFWSLLHTKLWGLGRNYFAYFLTKVGVIYTVSLKSQMVGWSGWIHMEWPLTINIVIVRLYIIQKFLLVLIRQYKIRIKKRRMFFVLWIIIDNNYRQIDNNYLSARYPKLVFIRIGHMLCRKNLQINYIVIFHLYIIHSESLFVLILR